MNERAFMLDRMLADAWPAAIVERVGSWRMRWAWGLTRRANSVAVLGPAPGTMDRIAERAETFYGAQGLPALFQVSDAWDDRVAADLKDRGYEGTAEVVVEIAPVETIAVLAVPDWKVVLHARPSDAWFETYWKHEGRRWNGNAERASRVYRSTFLRPRAPHAFAEVWHDDDLVAVAQGIAEHGWAGVQCLVTAPAWRRRGAAAAALGAIAEWAATLGARDVFLAVETDNEPALRAYGAAGFEESHRYRYWRQPAVGRSELHGPSLLAR